MNQVKDVTKTIAKDILRILGGYGVSAPAPDPNGIELTHVAWMCDQIIKNADSWPIDKTSRWLGYAQAILVIRNILPLKVQRDTTRPMFHLAYQEDGINVPPTVGL